MPNGNSDPSPISDAEPETRQAASTEGQLFADAFSAAPTAVLLVSLDGTVLRVNEQAVALSGYTEDDLIGFDFAEFALPEDTAVERRALQELITAARTTYECERPFVRADGETFYAMVSVGCVSDDRGRPLFLIAHVADVSTRRAAEDKFRGLLESAPDAVVIVDKAGRITLANGQAEILFGYTRDELTTLEVEALLPEASHAAHKRHRERFAAGPVLRPMGAGLALTARRRDGEELPVEVSLGPLDTAEGRLVMAAVRDVSEQRARERALRAANERFAKTIAHAPIGMALVTPERRLNEVNGALCRITGYSEQALLNMSLDELTHRDDLDGGTDFLEQLLGDAETVSVEKRWFNSSGHVVWVSQSAALVRDTDGSPLHFIVQIEDISERKLMESNLAYLADHDPLTGLWNRRRFEEEFEHQVARSRRYGEAASILLIDLDHFKEVNDTFGHKVGDDLLVRVAQVLNGRLRESDCVARLGGDEFAALMPHADTVRAHAIAAEIVSAVATHSLETGSVRVPSTVSVGIACVDGGGQDVTDSNDLMIEADLALYAAKERGRNQACLLEAGEAAERQAVGGLLWTHRIRDAVDSDGLLVYAQPIVDLATMSVAQYELLVRMKGTNGDVVLPAEFIDHAERFGVIGAIDRWVIEQGVDLLSRQQSLGRDLTLEINLSGKTISDPSLYAFIASLISDAGIASRSLIFEITETQAIENMLVARDFAERITALGASVAIDDFGSGFAGFQYVKSLPFDLLKIDGEFIRTLNENRTDQLVVEALVHVAAGLGKRTVAEFVADEGCLERVRTIGVDLAQGYYLGEPRPVHELIS